METFGLRLRRKNPSWIMSGCGERRVERKKKPERSKRTTERMKKGRNGDQKSPDKRVYYCIKLGRDGHRLTNLKRAPRARYNALAVGLPAFAFSTK
jgi:hypothetical protein